MKVNRITKFANGHIENEIETDAHPLGIHLMLSTPGTSSVTITKESGTTSTYTKLCPFEWSNGWGPHSCFLPAEYEHERHRCRCDFTKADHDYKEATT